MKCPSDGSTLAIAERNGVEIDYCPDCRGVWLDRGELDKILERASSMDNGPQPQHGSYASGQARGGGGDDDDRGYGGYRDQRSFDPRSGGRPPKKKNWLSEMLEFD